MSRISSRTSRVVVFLFSLGVMWLVAAPLPLAAQAGYSPRFVYTLGDNGITAYQVDADSGALTNVVPGSPFSSGVGIGGTGLAVDATGRLLFGVADQLSGFSVDAVTGALSSLPGSPIGVGGNWSQVVVGATGQYVYVASGYSYQGTVYAFQVGPSGDLAPVAGSPFVADNYSRTVFGLAVEPSGHFLYAWDGWSIDVLSIDATTGALTLVTSANSAYARCGGERMAVAGDATSGMALYGVYGPFGGWGISACSIDAATGALTPLAVYDNSRDFTFWSVAVSGNFVYAARAYPPGGYEGNIYGYLRDMATGALTPLPGSPFSYQAFDLAADPTGRLLYGVDNSGASAYTINPDGSLTPLAGSPMTPGGSNIAVVPLPADASPPVINCATSDGLWHGGNVSIACTAVDSESGLANPADASFTLSTSVPAGTENANASTATHPVCDRVGNCTTAGPVSGFKVDRKGPTISIKAPSGTYLLNQSAAAGYACTDGGSGVASCSGPVASGAQFDARSVGAKTFTVNAADDVGNSSSATASYTVQYAPIGTLCLGEPGHQILQPINADGTSVFKQGRTVPAKFRVCEAMGRSVGTPGVITDFRLIQIISGTGANVNETVPSASPDMAFRWDSANQQWIFNLSTNGLAANATYVYRITLNDATAIPFSFGLK